MPRVLPLFAALLVSACAQQVVVYPDAGGGADAAPALDAARADTGAPSADAGQVGDPDAGAGDAALADAGEGACYQDPFDTCDDPAEPADDRNDAWVDASRYHTTSVGCIQGDDLSPLMGSQPARMCPLDRADYYALTVVPCDTITMRMEVRLRMAEVCPAERYELALLYGGGLRACGEDFQGSPIQCLEEGADRIIRVLLPPDNSVQSWYFAVLTSADDVRFDYTLEVSVQ